MFSFQPWSYLGNPEERNILGGCANRGVGWVMSFTSQGPSLSQPASQPHVRRHGHWPVLLSFRGFLKGTSIEPCHCPGPQTDCQWVQVQRKLMWCIKSQEDPAGYTLWQIPTPPWLSGLTALMLFDFHWKLLRIIGKRSAWQNQSWLSHSGQLLKHVLYKSAAEVLTQAFLAKAIWPTSMT